MSFSSFSDLTDGSHTFSSTLMTDDGVVDHLHSMIRVEDGAVVHVESICGLGFGLNRDTEADIRKAVRFLLNTRADSLVLTDSGYTVFAPLVFNLGRKKK